MSILCKKKKDGVTPGSRHFYTPPSTVQGVLTFCWHAAVCVKKGVKYFEDLSPYGQRCLCALYLPSILLTHPWLTRSWREMSQGRTPWWASSTIRCRTTSGRGLPFTNTPPSWFTPPCPTRERNESKEGQGWVKERGIYMAAKLKPLRNLIRLQAMKWNKDKVNQMGATKWGKKFWGTKWLRI